MDSNPRSPGHGALCCRAPYRSFAAKGRRRRSGRDYRRFPRGDTGLLVRSATAGSLVRSAAIALLRGMLASMLLGLMMADHTAGPSPKEAMMAGIMPGDPADYRTFETAGGGR
jgi:hypothetical protein